MEGGRIRGKEREKMILFKFTLSMENKKKTLSTFNTSNLRRSSYAYKVHRL